MSGSTRRWCRCGTRTIATLRREGFKGEPEIEQRLEMRYFGQNYHREIPLASQRADTCRADFAAAAERVPRRLRRILRL